MATTRFIEYRGRKIVMMDFSRVGDTEEALRRIEEARQFVAEQPREKHLLTLVDATDSPFNRPITDALRKLSAHNRPYVIANATIGATGLKKTLLTMISRLTGRNLKAFDDMDAAKDWLIEQAEAFESES